jgi:predicted RNA binding protein YcfA (HicA-like mRNA interferase family)
LFHPTGLDTRDDYAEASREGSDLKMPTYYDDLVDIMKAHGCWRVDGGKGSHEKWRSPINNRTVTVPKSKSRHTANGVLKQLGIDKKF